MLPRRGPLYLIGGKQKNRKMWEWQKYEHGLVVRFDPETNCFCQQVAYTSPPEVCPDRAPSFVFTAASMEGNRMYVCTSMIDWQIWSVY